MAAGCAHHTDPVHELNSEIAPFTHSRDQAVELVTTSKHSLGASDLNSLAVSYGALQEKGDAHAAFLVEVISDASFNGDRNAKYASNLTQAIKTFNKSFASVSAANQTGATVQSAWIPAFSNSITAYWAQYHTAMAAISPQMMADLIKQLKAETVWPNYENIATEPISAPTRTRRRFPPDRVKKLESGRARNEPSDP